MRVKLNTLINVFDCWEYVPNPGKNVLPSTWAFKIKCYPDGWVKKFKARFCARGDRQQEGIDYFKTWAPVVQWSTVRIVMILAAKLKLILVQCNITATFIHGRVTETIYVHHQGGSTEYKAMRCSNSSAHFMGSSNRLVTSSNTSQHVSLNRVSQPLNLTPASSWVTH